MQPKQISMNRLMAVPVAAIAIGLIVVLGITIQGAAANISDLQSQLETTSHIVEKRQALKNELTGSIEELKNQLAGIEASQDSYIIAYDSIAESGDSLNNDLVAAVDNMVEDLALSGISHTSGLNITGYALSEEEILTYVRNLDASGRFAEITITNLNRPETENETPRMNFNLALRLK